LVTTDGFLYPTRVLEERGLMHRKGFPESYDLKRILNFLGAVKSAAPGLQVPVYSHDAYDILPGRFQSINQPDIVIFEGLNVLQAVPGAASVASDYFDFSIYLDAETPAIERWYIERFMLLQRTIPAAVFLFPPLQRPQRGRGRGHRPHYLARNQPAQSAGEYPANPGACPPRRP
jgi:type I pantothenate kinase